MHRFLICFALLAAPIAFAAKSQSGTARAMEGPMVGYVTPTEIALWVRVSGEFPVKAEFSTAADFANSIWSSEVTASRNDDLAVDILASGLQPGTDYFYRVYINGNPMKWPQDTQPTLKTHTAPAGPSKFRLGFGSCARASQDGQQEIWKTVTQQDPDLFFWVGDNIYGDSLVPEITLAAEYRRQRSVPLLQPVNHSVPQLAVWDDHDFALNDHDRTNPVKDEALKVFQWYWTNPSHGLPDAPGVFFKYTYGGVDFFMLDCRYHRDPNEDPDGPNKTFLGAAQLAWLKEGLKASKAPFKVLVSGSGWTAAKGQGGDSWSSALHERNALFDYIRDAKIGGVVLLSGDTHTGECNAIDWSEKGGYDLYDLVSSPLAQGASQGWRNRSPEVRVRPGFEKANVGIIDFDLTAKTPTLSFNLYDAEGNAAWEPLVLTTKDLKNGNATAKKNVQD